MFREDRMAEQIFLRTGQDNTGNPVLGGGLAWEEQPQREILGQLVKQDRSQCLRRVLLLLTLPLGASLFLHGGEGFLGGGR